MSCRKWRWESIKLNLVLWLPNVEELHYLKFLSSVKMGYILNLGIKVDVRCYVITLWLKNASFNRNVHVNYFNEDAFGLLAIVTAILTTIIKYWGFIMFQIL